MMIMPLMLTRQLDEEALALEGAEAGAAIARGACGKSAAPQLHDQIGTMEAALQRAEPEADSVVASAGVREPGSLKDTAAGRHIKSAPQTSRKSASEWWISDRV